MTLVSRRVVAAFLALVYLAAFSGAIAGEIAIWLFA